ncbi:unnamed protein product [Bursaphelenchus xylophilus]|uniref:(pine wood nematode) hypothetical protein n=1 Tax=Bursaphelenchus xylophilus TaxID=6326 RepID=A0A1I7RXC1_BURXY|nr:unnamed protein product [Bursaphelenchus xylophilus]CAG9121550.1 unnamed protein product [Bursaphelenchus xylophilus]
MSESDQKPKKKPAPAPSARRSSGMLKTKEVTEIPMDRRLLKSYTGTSEYRREFYDVWVKPATNCGDEAAIQTAVIQCKKCNMLMRNEGGHIKNHVIHTCAARKDRQPKVGRAKDALKPSENQQKPEPPAHSTANISPLPAMIRSSPEAKCENLDPNADQNFDMTNFFKEQALLMLVNSALAQNSLNNNVEVEQGQKRKISENLERETKRPRMSTITRRKMRQNMLRTKDMEKISRDRYVLRSYTGTSEYRKQFYDVWIKNSAEEPDEAAVETAVIQCKNCSRIMSNEGGHIKSHVQSACKGQPDSRTSPKSVQSAPNTPPCPPDDNNAVLQLLLLQQLSQLQSQGQIYEKKSPQELLARLLNPDPAPSLFPLSPFTSLLGTQF